MDIWFDSVRKEKEEISQAQINLVAPITEVQKGDHVFAVANDELRKIYYLIYQRQKRAVELDSTPVLNGRERWERTLDRLCLDGEIESLETSFWTSVFVLFRDSLNTSSARYFVRKGWKLVWVEKHEESSPSSSSGQILVSGSRRFH